MGRLSLPDTLEIINNELKYSKQKSITLSYDMAKQITKAAAENTRVDISTKYREENANLEDEIIRLRKHIDELEESKRQLRALVNHHKALSRHQKTYNAEKRRQRYLKEKAGNDYGED